MGRKGFSYTIAPICLCYLMILKCFYKRLSYVEISLGSSEPFFRNEQAKKPSGKKDEELVERPLRMKHWVSEKAVGRGFD